MKEKVISLIRDAAEIIKNRPEFSVDEKEGHANYVTTVDKQLQDALEKGLAAIYPEAQFIGEEKENALLIDAPAWVVDPLDGTANFICDYRKSAVSVALLEKRKPVLGAVYQPYTDEMFFAEKGGGAFLNGRPIHVSRREFSRAMVSFGTSPYDADKCDITMSLARDFISSCADIRRSGSAALDLTDVACGRTDVFFEMILRPWDVSAGALLVTEAGGVFDMPLLPDGLDFGGNHCILAGSPAVFDEAKRMLLDKAAAFGYKE